MKASTSTPWTFASPDETIAWGRMLGASLVGGLVIGLTGPLGAGKTRLVKGLAEGNANGRRAPKVTSPTFTLIHEYPGKLPLYHLDAYRLNAEAELMALGFDELCRDDSVVVVEWCDRVQAVMPEDLLTLNLNPTGATTRSLTMIASGAVSEQCVANLLDRSTQRS